MGAPSEDHRAAVRVEAEHEHAVVVAREREVLVAVRV
jgi:hypothetical protein